MVTPVARSGTGEGLGVGEGEGVGVGSGVGEGVGIGVGVGVLVRMMGRGVGVGVGSAVAEGSGVAVPGSPANAEETSVGDGVCIFGVDCAVSSGCAAGDMCIRDRVEGEAKETCEGWLAAMHDG